MIIREITYTDFNGVERTEEFAFHLSKAELVEMEFGKEGGMEAFIKKIVNTLDVNKLIQLWKMFILKAYGVKSDDGRRFIKSEELTREFTQTEAYTTLFMELATNTEAAIEFINKIVPSDVQAAIEEANN